MGTAKLKFAVKLRCPYCGQKPLIDKWFKLAEGCSNCEIQYAIDESHYSGASQLIAFPVAAVLGLVEGALIWWQFKIDTLLVAMISFVSMFFFLLLFWPFAIALWIWLEHFLRPVRVRSTMQVNLNSKPNSEN